MKSKYEIVLQETTNVIFNEHDLLFTGLSKAMDEYAKQVAMDYLKWINGTNIADERLYNTYLQSKQ